MSTVNSKSKYDRSLAMSKVLASVRLDMEVKTPFGVTGIISAINIPSTPHNIEFGRATVTVWFSEDRAKQHGLKYPSSVFSLEEIMVLNNMTYLK